MNIDKKDASDALQMYNVGISNSKGCATSMLQMLDNAVRLNERLLATDPATDWVQIELQAIIDTPSHPGSDPFPFSLRHNVFKQIKNLYQQAYWTEHRIAPMAYPPLGVAAQCLANIAFVNSCALAQTNPQRDSGLVSHDMMAHIDDTATPIPFWMIFASGDRVYVNLMDHYLTKCEEALEKEPVNEQF